MTDCHEGSHDPNPSRVWSVIRECNSLSSQHDTHSIADAPADFSTSVAWVRPPNANSK